jgi:chromate reductase
MTILCFAASNSSKSINHQLVNFVANQIEKVEMIRLQDFDMPIYSSDIEEDSGIPENAQSFLDKIKQANGIIISFAEHNGSYTVAYKNVFDWASRINSKVYQGKPMMLLSASPGPGAAKSVLAQAENSMPFFDGKVVSTFSLPSFFDNFDAEAGKIVNQDLSTGLDKALKVFLAAT